MTRKPRSLQVVQVAPEELPFLLTEVLLNPQGLLCAHDAVLVLNAPALYAAIQAVLSLLASRRTTGFVRDGLPHTISIYDGCALPLAQFRLKLADH